MKVSLNAHRTHRLYPIIFIQGFTFPLILFKSRSSVCLIRSAKRVALNAPAIRPTTIPSLKNIVVGIDLISYCPESFGLSSTFTFRWVTVGFWEASLKNWCESTTRSAPIRPEIDNRYPFCRNICNESHNAPEPLVGSKRSLL